VTTAPTARTGDSLVPGAAPLAAAAFDAAVERSRRELFVHAYRMLASHQDAEDAVQEALLRAWRGRHTYGARAGVRARLYRITTNVCLDLLKGRPRRVLPYDVVASGHPDGTLPAESGDHAWVGPVPSELLEPADAGPDVVAVARETVGLAFLAAIQYLPPRQRAVLILRDALGWPARDAATVLDLSVPAVKSALQRARATLRTRLPGDRLDWRAKNTAAATAERELAARYVAALEHGGAALADVLGADLRISFPPRPLWYDGRAEFADGRRGHAAPGDYRFLLTSANLRPAVAVYLRRPGDTAFRALALEVVAGTGGRVTEIVDYNGARIGALFAAFGLPPPAG
jgi:RNA polymerase sigma-70 factor (ECF subfamily)